MQGYSEFRLAKYPTVTPLIHEYSQGSDPANSLGPHWERPGRTILDEHFLAIPDPNTIISDAFRDFTRIFFTGRSIHRKCLASSIGFDIFYNR